MQKEVDCLWLQRGKPHVCASLNQELARTWPRGKPITPDNCPLWQYSDGHCRVCIEANPGQVEREMVPRR